MPLSHRRPRLARDQGEMNDRLARQIVALLRDAPREVRDELRRLLAEMNDQPTPASEDEPAPFADRRRPGGAQDSAPHFDLRSPAHRGFEQRFPNAARITNLG